MSEKVELELKIKGGDKAIKTLGQLEKELNDAREAIKEVEVGSQAFETLAQKIQKTGSEIKTLEKQMEGLEPQQKAEAFLKMGEGIAGGFAIGQASMALLGVESENLEKLQVKVQAAISIAMGVRMMSEAALMATTAKRVAMEKIALVQTKMSTAVQKVNTVVNVAAAAAQKLLTFAIGTSTVALKALKIAIMATGLGALVVLIGSIIGAVVSWTSKTEINVESQKKLNAETLKQNNEFQRNLDLQNNLADATTETEKRLVRLRNEQITYNSKLSKNSEQLKENEEALKTVNKASAENARIIKKNSTTLANNSKVVRDHLTLLNDQIRAQEDLIEKEKADEAKSKQRSSERKSRRKTEAQDLLTLQREVALLNIEDEDERNKVKLQMDRQQALDKAENAKNSREQILLINERFDILEAERKQKVADEEYDAFIENSNKFNEQYEANAEKQKEIDQKAKDDKIALDKAVFDARKNMQANALSAGAALFEKNKKISKAIAVSQTIFSTQQAIVDALAAKGTDALLPYPIRLGNAISAGVIGAASVRNILSENMGADVSAGGGGGGTPEPMTPATTGAFSLGGGIEQEPLKAFVVTDELSDSQDQLADIRRRATI